MFRVLPFLLCYNFLAFCILSTCFINLLQYYVFTCLPIHLTNVPQGSEFTSGISAADKREEGDGKPVCWIAPYSLPLDCLSSMGIKSSWLLVVFITRSQPTLGDAARLCRAVWGERTAPGALQISALNGSLYSGQAFRMMDALLF